MAKEGKRVRRANEIMEVSSPITLDELLKIEGDSADLSFDFPAEISLAEIEVADEVFQRRIARYNILARESHVRDLMGIVADGKPLDELLVTRVGGRVFVVDGHHRLTAYRSHGWERPVPVKWFQGSVKDARDLAFAENNKNRLMMQPADRMEAAWDLIKTRDDGSRSRGLSKTEIKERTRVSVAQIGIMRKAWAENPKLYEDLTWAEVRRHQRGATAIDDGWRSKEVERLAKILQRTASWWLRRPDILCDALEALEPSLPGAMVSCWPDHAQAVVDQREEDGANGLDI